MHGAAHSVRTTADKIIFARGTKLYVETGEHTDT